MLTAIPHERALEGGIQHSSCFSKGIEGADFHSSDIEIGISIVGSLGFS